MKNRLKFAGKVCLAFGLMIALAFGVCVALIDMNPGRERAKETPSVHRPRQRTAVRKAWNRREDGSPMLYGDGWFDDSGYFFAVLFNGEMADPGSLEQVGTALAGRGRRGLEYLRGVLADVPRDDPTAPQQIVQLHLSIGGLHMYEGEFDAAVREFEAARDCEPDRRRPRAGELRGPAGDGRSEARRGRELRRVLQRGELHLSAGTRGDSPPDEWVEGSDAPLHGLPRESGPRTWAFAGS